MIAHTVDTLPPEPGDDVCDGDNVVEAVKVLEDRAIVVCVGKRGIAVGGVAGGSSEPVAVMLKLDSCLYSTRGTWY